MKSLCTGLLLAALVCAPAQELNDSVFTRVGFSARLPSQYLDQERDLFIHLPVNHDTLRSYPLVLLLDGEVSFKAFASATELMSWQRLIPQCIVVGIPNVDRDNDYAPAIEGIEGSGRADSMLAFYRYELFPFLEQRYPINGKIIWGHSWAGFFVTYIMLQDPSLFDAYIVTSPAMRFLESIHNPEDPFHQMDGQEIRFFMSLGGEELVGEEMKQFVGILENNAPASLKTELMVREGKNHDSNALPGYMDGLEFIFKR